MDRRRFVAALVGAAALVVQEFKEVDLIVQGMT